VPRPGPRSFDRQRIAESLTLCFVVKDTGIGIAHGAQSQLFAPFSQADTSITRRFGGTGLGLSIVKRLIHLMGGELAFDSTEGVGSEFSFTLASPEALAVREDSSAAPHARALAGVRILVVDDSDTNREMTKRILELHGARVWLSNVGGDTGRSACRRLGLSRRRAQGVGRLVRGPALQGGEIRARGRARSC
jgi:Histidine kinase-, DNA gyrase B-, and HSP90-like ATPase